MAELQEAGNNAALENKVLLLPSYPLMVTILETTHNW